jgi:hypothetical protein
MKTTTIILVIMAVALAAAAGCAGNGGDGVTPTPAQTIPPTPATGGVQLQGSGDTVRSIELDEGLWLFEMTSTGTGEFTALLESRFFYGQLASDMGPYHGTNVMGLVQNGSYQVNVTAAGDWTIVVTRPEALPAPADTPPMTFVGLGDAATGLFNLSAGNVTFNITSDGTAGCSFWLYKENGDFVWDPTNTYVEPLPWHDGPYSGERTVAIPESGRYLLDIVSDGSWSIGIA